jgi:protein SCO1/2
VSCPSPEQRTILHRLSVLLLLLGVLAGCNGHGPPWRTKAITGIMPDLSFTLTDEHNHTVHAGDYAGKVVLLFFGFSHCQMTCPATLEKLSSVLGTMGKRADRARVLFVSVDPHRDTPARLAAYTSAFAPQVVGLTGTEQQLQSLSKRYRVAFSYGKGYPDGDYPVYHSSAVFVFDGTGKVRLLFQQSDKIDAVSADLTRLLHEGARS